MKTKAKFTPGPWAVKPAEPGKHYLRIRGTVLGQTYKIANVIIPTYNGVHEREHGEARANANLIANAPCLARALLILVRTIERGDFCESEVANARAVMMKAGIE